MFLCHIPKDLLSFLFFFWRSVCRKQLRKMKMYSYNVSFLLPVSRNMELISRYVINIPVNYI